jgi:hypothetical protein
MKAERLENQPRKNPALSLLAMILQGGTASVNAETGKLKISPARLAMRLKDQIIAQKINLIRLLLGFDCPVCGFLTQRDTVDRPEEKKTFLRDFCPKNPAHFDRTEECARIRVFDKTGKEI